MNFLPADAQKTASIRLWTGKMTVEQAREELERLAKDNACLMDVSPEGLVVFRFPEFETVIAVSSA